MRVTLLEPTATISADIVYDVLLLVVPPDEIPPLEVISKWTPLEQSIVYDWAIREHLGAAGNRVQRRRRPYLAGGGS